MKRALVAALLVGSSALADIPPDDSWQCQGKAAGVECVTQAGLEGVCTSKLVPRWDYRHGLPPKTIHVELMICVAPVAGPAPRSALAGVLLAMMAMLAAFFSRRRPA